MLRSGAAGSCLAGVGAAIATGGGGGGLAATATGPGIATDPGTRAVIGVASRGEPAAGLNGIVPNALPRRGKGERAMLSTGGAGGAGRGEPCEGAADGTDIDGAGGESSILANMGDRPERIDDTG